MSEILREKQKAEALKRMRSYICVMAGTDLSRVSLAGRTI